MTPRATVITPPEGTKAIPKALVDLRDMIVYSVASVMRGHMIRKIDIGLDEYTPWGALRPSYWSFKDIERPKELELVLTEVVRSLCTLLRLYGVTSVELEMSPDELEDLNNVVSRAGTVRVAPDEPPVLNDG